MKKRGKVVRDTSVGVGLLVADGKQYTFELEGMWLSETAPRVNMVVDVEIDEDSNVLSVTAVPETQLAREQAEVALQLAREKGGKIGKEAMARFGGVTLIAMGALVLGWLVLNMISVRISSDHTQGITFWNVLGMLNNSGGFMEALNGRNTGAGMYGFFAIVCLAGPLLPFIIKDRRASLAGALPLIYMVFAGMMIYASINEGVKEASSAAALFGGQEAARFASSMAEKMARSVLEAMSIGLGGYLSLAASVFFAGRGLKQYLTSRV